MGRHQHESKLSWRQKALQNERKWEAAQALVVQAQPAAPTAASLPGAPASAAAAGSQAVVIELSSDEDSSDVQDDDDDSPSEYSDPAIGDSEPQQTRCSTCNRVQSFGCDDAECTALRCTTPECSLSKEQHDEFIDCGDSECSAAVCHEHLSQFNICHNCEKQMCADHNWDLCCNCQEPLCDRCARDTFCPCGGLSEGAMEEAAYETLYGDCCY